MLAGSNAAKPFLDGVLVRAGEGRKHEVADVGMTRMNGQLVAGFRAMRDRVDVGKVELRIDALGVQVHRERHDVDVAGALTVTEQRAFHALGASHHGEFRGRYAGTAIVVRVDADDDTVTARDVACRTIRSGRRRCWASPFRRWREDSGSSCAAASVPDSRHRVADLHREVSSVPVKLSGLYWKIQSVSGRSSASFVMSSAPFTAMSTMPARSSLKTTRRCNVDVEL